MRKLILKIRRKYDKHLNRFRIWKLRLLGAKIGRDVRCYGKIILLGDPRNLTIGDGTELSTHVVLNCRDKLTIGKGVVLSSFVQIHTANVNPNALAPRPHESKPVVLEDYVGVFANCVIAHGVTIGKYAVIAGGSVVINDAKPGWLYFGVPARPIKALEAVAAEVQTSQGPGRSPDSQS